MLIHTQQMPRLLLGICLSLFLAISGFGQTSQYAGTYTGNFNVGQWLNGQTTTSNSLNTIKIDGQGNLIDVYNSDGTPWGLRNRPNFSRVIPYKPRLPDWRIGQNNGQNQDQLPKPIATEPGWRHLNARDCCGDFCRSTISRHVVFPESVCHRGFVDNDNDAEDTPKQDCKSCSMPPTESSGIIVIAVLKIR
jgi:hypothetical protein